MKNFLKIISGLSIVDEVIQLVESFYGKGKVSVNGLKPVVVGIYTIDIGKVIRKVPNMYKLFTANSVKKGAFKSTPNLLLDNALREVKVYEQKSTATADNFKRQCENVLMGIESNADGGFLSLWIDENDEAVWTNEQLAGADDMLQQENNGLDYFNSASGAVVGRIRFCGVKRTILERNGKTTDILQLVYFIVNYVVAEKADGADIDELSVYEELN